MDSASAAAAAAAIRQSSPRSLASTEEQTITSGSSLWQHAKHRQQLGNSTGSISAMLAPTPINCTASHLSGGGNLTNVSRATPTSSDQINDYDHHSRDKDVCIMRGANQMSRNSAICDPEHDEEVIVDHADNDDCGKKNSQRIDLKRDDKNR